jgi:3-hydroxyacyl-CoA dehydrogenase / enoyl-CoA hydratase / 3-hydroxybutyryl-CoA epimerase
MTSIETCPGVVYQAPGGDGIGRLITDGAAAADLQAGLRLARADAALSGVLVVIGRADPQAESATPEFQAVCSDLAALPCTTVATIAGPAVGKDLELALACDYRVAADDANVVIGLPEVSMGLIPSGGGTQRLPRLIGLRRALDLILRGRRLKADQARVVGVLDAVVLSGTLDETALAWVRKPKRTHLLPGRMSPVGLAERTPIGRRIIFGSARRALPDHYPAMRRALEAIELGYSRGLEAGLAEESRAVRELASSASTRNLTWLSLAAQEQRARFPSDRAMRIAVIGRSAMGAALNELVGDRQVAPANAELIVVAVRDDLEHQRAAVREVEALVRPDATIAVHTSSIPLSEIASAASRPERIVGMRFIAPVHRTRLLEVVQHERAAESAVAVAAGLGTMLDKTVIVVSDGPGFFTTRVLGLMLNEAALLVDEGARVDSVDRAMRQFGFAVGPLRLLDEVGLEVIQRIAEPLEKAFGDCMPRPRVTAELVAAGCVGRTSHAGFYLWHDTSRLDRLLRRPRRLPNPAVYRRAQPVEIDQATIQNRLALPFVNECIRCLEDGVLRSPADGDLGAILGIGFPPFLGGPFHYADSLGLDVLIDKLNVLAEQHGTRFRPTELLLERARDGRPFFED